MRPLIFAWIVLTTSLPHAIAWQLPCHTSRPARSAALLPHESKHASPRLGRTTLAVFAGQASSGQRARGRGGRSKRGGRGEGKNALKGLWRVFNVEVPASEDAGKDSVAVTGTVVDKLEGKLGVAPGTIRADAVTTVRKSFDARRDRRKVKQEPHFQYVLDVDFGAATAVRLKPEPGKLERSAGDAASPYDTVTAPPRLPVAIVGAGPAGLFCALHLAEAGVPCVVYERGQPVEERGRDIGAMLHRRLLHPESNICYGEGGAGTWSDGKLTTRIGRNSGQVRRVLQELVRFGAPPEILVLGKPHLGTDRLVRILKSLRQHLEDKGVVFHFGTRVEDVTLDPASGALTSITVRKTEHASIRDSFAQDAATRASFVAAGALDAVDVPASQVVMAAGHSARELFDCLATKPATARALRMAPFAVGFRIEHPQESINALQLGAEWSQRVHRGAGDIPVADYRLATEIPYPVPAGRDREPFQRGGVKAVLSDGWGGAAEDPGGGKGGGGGGPGLAAGEGGGKEGVEQRGGKERERGWEEGVEQRGGKERGRPVYSFCMCPGGQIMCTSVLPDELCVNGMSFSRRQSKWANSALVGRPHSLPRRACLRVRVCVRACVRACVHLHTPTPRAHTRRYQRSISPRTF